MTFYILYNMYIDMDFTIPETHNLLVLKYKKKLCYQCCHITDTVTGYSHGSKFHMKISFEQNKVEVVGQSI